MSSLQPITIVVACDNHYVILLAALLKSIEINHHTSERLNFYIVDDNISDKNKKKLQRSVDGNIITLHWLRMKDTVPPGMKLPLDYTTFPLTAYIRLFIPYFVSPEIEKVIYIDVDMIVQNDISNLWSTDLDDHVIAAVQDSRVKTFDNSWGGVLNYKEFGLDPCTKYFNSGLLIINTKEWRKLDITEKVVGLIKENVKYANYPDQYGLNVVLANKWLELDSRWNHFASEKINNPYLIHFIGRKPIYNSYGYSEEYKAVFYKYLQQTEWRNFKSIGEARRYMKKFTNVIEKIRLFN